MYQKELLKQHAIIEFRDGNKLKTFSADSFVAIEEIYDKNLNTEGLLLTVTGVDISLVRNFPNPKKGEVRLFTIQLQTEDGHFVKYTRTMECLNRVKLDDMNDRATIKNARIVFYIKGDNKPLLRSINGVDVRDENLDISKDGATNFRRGSIKQEYKGRD